MARASRKSQNRDVLVARRSRKSLNLDVLVARGLNTYGNRVSRLATRMFWPKEIQNLILSNKKVLKLENIDNLKNVNLEIPPQQFNFDLSCNIAMVLGKSNKINPKELAKKIKEIFLKKIINFSMIEIAGPGFLNIKLSNTALIRNINLILENNKTYGSKNSKETFGLAIGLDFVETGASRALRARAPKEKHGEAAPAGPGARFGKFPTQRTPRHCKNQKF